MKYVALIKLKRSCVRPTCGLQVSGVDGLAHIIRIKFVKQKHIQSDCELDRDSTYLVFYRFVHRSNGGSVHSESFLNSPKITPKIPYAHGPK